MIENPKTLLTFKHPYKIPKSPKSQILNHNPKPETLDTKPYILRNHKSYRS